MKNTIKYDSRNYNFVEDSDSIDEEEELNSKIEDSISDRANLRFKHYNDIFNAMTKSSKVNTLYPLINCVITYDSYNAITVTKKNEREYYIK